MDTLTIEISDPKVRALIDNLISLDLVKVVPTLASWRDRWQTLSATLPDTDSLSEKDILAEIQAVREARVKQP